jgi:microcystin-dependent protein
MDVFIGLLLPVAFNYAPKGFASCNGALLPIAQNQALFALLGTTFGGDGRITFGLPNLQGRIAVGAGAGVTVGQTGGASDVTLTIGQIPAHNHLVSATAAGGSTPSPRGGQLASVGMWNASVNTPMDASTVTTVGGSQPHTNQQPYLAINWLIALQGIFPSQN